MSQGSQNNNFLPPKPHPHLAQLTLPPLPISNNPDQEVELTLIHGKEESVHKTPLHHLLDIVALITPSQPKPELVDDPLLAPPKTSTAPKKVSNPIHHPPPQRKLRFLNLSKPPITPIKVSPGPKPSQKWQFTCNFCQKPFRTSTSFSRHLSQHTRAVSYPCLQCGKTFSKKGNLTDHSRLHNPDPRVRRPFLCPQCGKGFTHKCHLTRHVATVHSVLKQFQNWAKVEDDDDMKSRHICPELCGKTFKCTSGLRKHVQKAHSQGGGLGWKTRHF